MLLIFGKNKQKNRFHFMLLLCLKTFFLVKLCFGDRYEIKPQALLQVVDSLATDAEMQTKTSKGALKADPRCVSSGRSLPSDA